MKKIFLFAVFLFAGSYAASAQQATINGSIKGHSGEPIYASYNRMIDTIKVATDGSFVLHPKVEEKTGVSFFGIEGASVALEIGKGQTVNFAVNANAPVQDIVRFTGDNAAMNDYLTSYNILTGYAAWPQEKIAAASFKAYESEVDKTFATLRNKLAKVEDMAVRAELEKNLDLTQRTFYFRYAWAVRNINKAAIDGDSDFVKYAQGIDLNDRRIIGEPRRQVTYANLLEQRLRWEVERSDKYKGVNSSARYYAAIADLVTDPDVANELASQNFSKYAAIGMDENLMETFEAYKKVANDPEAIAKMEVKVRQLDELSAGKMAPDFVLVDADGNKCRLSDLRGRNIYIDVWATWCGPCVAEIPYVEKLHEKYKDSANLEFISISVDDNVGAWKKKLETDKPQWRNFVTEGGFANGPMNKLYYISGIPRFILIDKEGRIVSVNAPRPSSDKIDEFLARYL